LTVLFALPRAEEDDLLKRASLDEAPKVARMARYLLQLRANVTLARHALKQFRQPNEIFFCENFWKLYQIRKNADQGTQNVFQDVITKTGDELTGQFVRRHVRAISL